MTAAEVSTPIGRMREVLAARVAATSLRQVAREVGMSPTGLQKVLDGADSYSRTRRKLERWYVRESAHARGGLDAYAVSAALRVAVQDLPPSRQSATLERLLAELESAYAAGDLKAPDWLDELRRMIRS